eukprot:scaffold45186_cov107-Phaeocystis_antarctica.AAC.1
MHLRCTRCESSASRRSCSPMMSSAARFGSRHRGVCSTNAMMLPGCRIVDVQSRTWRISSSRTSSRCPTCLARRRFSARAVAQRWAAASPSSARGRRRYS